MKITFPDNCDNAPKQKIVKDFLQACLEGHVDKADENLTEDVDWDSLSVKRMQGKDAVIAALQTMDRQLIKNVDVESILSHGNQVVDYGVMDLNNTQSTRFCNVHVFNGFGPEAKIQKITTCGITIGLPDHPFK